MNFYEYKLRGEFSKDTYDAMLCMQDVDACLGFCQGYACARFASYAKYDWDLRGRCGQTSRYRKPGNSGV